MSKLLNPNGIIRDAQTAIHAEAEAIGQLGEHLSKDFAKVVQSIVKSRAKVILSGVGKSAIIARNITATLLNSTGTPSVFMHAGEAIHGDLGIVQERDLIILLSKSGNTPEIKALLHWVKGMEKKNKTVAITGNPDSYLGQNVDYVLNTHVEGEAWPNGLTPITSSTTQLVMGDALAICLMKLRKFSDTDFAQYHPGGTLGKRLYLRVEDLVDPEQRPAVAPEADLKTLILSISKSRLGMTAVLEGENLVGIITDGDLRRMLSQQIDLERVTAREVMSSQPKSVSQDALAQRAMEMLQNFQIGQLLVLKDKTYYGVIDIHSLIREGIV